MRPFFAIVLFTFLCPLFHLKAEPTRIVVRALANDAKFIGSSMGAPRVVISNALTGEVLATGNIEGGTGNTEILMKQPHQRYQTLADEKTAKFEAQLDLEVPTQVNIEVFAPGFPDQNQGYASRKIWMIPGEDITGDGIILDISGFVLDLIEPHGRQSFKTGSDVPVKISATMMCGCPITEGGLWDASRFQVKGILMNGDETINSFPLNYAGETNIFTGSFKASKAGNHTLWVYIIDPETGNTGVGQAMIGINE